MSNSSCPNNVLVALDVQDAKAAFEYVRQLSPYVGGFKVGLELYTREGLLFVKELVHRGTFVFLDLKLCDIPNTIFRTVRSLAASGVGMLNLHAFGGKEMMRAAVTAVQEGCPNSGSARPKLIAVTVLTSLSEKDIEEMVGVRQSVQDMVRRWAGLARDAGLDGVVASAWEIDVIRQECGKDFLIVTPGVRPLGTDKGDQKRTVTPKQAIERGADFLVIGRPILAAEDPVKAAQTILAEIRS